MCVWVGVYACVKCPLLSVYMYRSAYARGRRSKVLKTIRSPVFSREEKCNIAVWFLQKARSLACQVSDNRCDVGSGRQKKRAAPDAAEAGAA